VVAPLDLVGVPEIAEMLGATRRTVWRYVSRPEFPDPAAEVNRKRLWERGAVMEWARATLPLPYDRRRKKTS
jgi:predicted DNA-binding transcriptional regulator AlpA